ncbi:MAG: hypothetical protein FWH19_05780 [Treponema sp.]|nr:hypothetical protein [Treponema sp.]
MKLTTIARFFPLTLLVMALAASCVTGPVVVPENLTPMELIQRGQEASHRNRFAHALQYYEALLLRFPNDRDSVCAAEYEIAFIHYKQKRYDLARTEFNNLLARYNSPDAALLPPQFRILSNVVLARIDEIEAGARRR